MFCGKQGPDKEGPRHILAPPYWHTLLLPSSMLFVSSLVPPSSSSPHLQTVTASVVEGSQVAGGIKESTKDVAQVC